MASRSDADRKEPSAVSADALQEDATHEVIEKPSNETTSRHSHRSEVKGTTRRRFLEQTATVGFGLVAASLFADDALKAAEPGAAARASTRITPWGS